MLGNIYIIYVNLNNMKSDATLINLARVIKDRINDWLCRDTHAILQSKKYIPYSLLYNFGV